MRSFQFLIPVSLVLAALGLSPVHAGLIAQYDFDDLTVGDSSGSANQYDLGVFGSAPDTSQGAYYSDGNPDNYLAVAGPGGMSDWTVSLWARVGQNGIDQGDFMGLFSNDTSPSEASSFQVDSHFGEYRLISSASNNQPFILGTPVANTWQNIVIQKVGGNDAQLFFDGGLVGSTGSNPGGLENFRLGVNRNTNRSFTGYIDNVQIWDDSNVSARQIYADGVGFNAVPLPGTIALLGLGLLGLGAAARRSRFRG